MINPGANLETCQQVMSNILHDRNVSRILYSCNSIVTVVTGICLERFDTLLFDYRDIFLSIGMKGMLLRLDKRRDCVRELVTNFFMP